MLPNFSRWSFHLDFAQGMHCLVATHLDTGRVVRGIPINDRLGRIAWIDADKLIQGAPGVIEHYNGNVRYAVLEKVGTLNQDMHAS